MANKNGEFSKIRAFLWPIHGHELRRFVPMLVLFFLISVNYHLLRIMKDTLIVTAPNSGAEAIPFLKVWAMLPTAIFFTFLFTKFSNKFNKEKLFYMLMSIFIGFFIIFTFILYPYREIFHLDSLSNYLQTILPLGFKGLIATIKYWTFSLFYVMAESWSNIVLTTLIWGFANDVTNVKEAGRFYAFFGIGVNAAGILAGDFGETIAINMTKTDGQIPTFMSWLGCKNSWDETFLIFMFIILACGLASVYIYRRLHVKIFTQRNLHMNTSNEVQQEKKKLSLRESLSYVFKSKYLLCVAMIVLSYNILINLTEVLWKSQINELYHSPQAYTAYFSKTVFFTGIIATVSSYFISGNIIRRFGWKFTALITPIIIFSTGAFFFYFLFLKEYFNHPYLTIFGFTPLVLTVFFGSLQNILARSAKYTVFDSTKEIALIPLDSEGKWKGKATIDGIGSRLGKSGASLMLQFLIVFFSTTIAASPAIAFIMLLMLPIWLFSIFKVNKEFQTFSTEPASTTTSL